MTYKQLYENGAEELKKAGIEDADFDARELLLSLMDCSETRFLLLGNENADEKTQAAYYGLIRRRASGEPLQYIIGKWNFLNCEFYVGTGVLIPRPETEQLADLCIKKVKKDNIGVVYDLCAGSGCIGISIAKACPGTTVYLFEKYEDAADFCRKNIPLNGVTNAHLIRCDIFDGLPSDLPLPGLIVSNPPYIPADEMQSLQKEVLFEPRTALDGGEDGLIFYRSIAEKWVKSIAAPVSCAFECGEGQPEDICELFSAFGKTDIVTDFYGVRRFVTLNY